MLRKKILFWLVWILAAPLVFIYYSLSRRGYAYYINNMPAFKTGLVRQAVWEKLVLEKPVIRHTVDRYGKKGSP